MDAFIRDNFAVTVDCGEEFFWFVNSTGAENGAPVAWFVHTFGADEPTYSGLTDAEQTLKTGWQVHFDHWHTQGILN